MNDFEYIFLKVINLKMFDFFNDNCQELLDLI